MIALSLCNRPAHPDDLDLFTKKVLYSRSSLLKKNCCRLSSMQYAGDPDHLQKEILWYNTASLTLQADL